jgi:phosphoribosyl 1,2-cyclic phosphodiesterase
MSLYFASLNSGSNGNCYYVGNDTEAVLIDVGISCRETEKRMKRCGLDISRIKAIFISHEHSDHISGVQVLSHKYQLPVYITNATLNNCRLTIAQELAFHFEANKPVTVGGLIVNAFKKYHDACDPHSFIVSSNNTNIGIFTDIGRVCDDLIYHFKKCNAAILEANYDATMLATGNYPYHLKRRITNGHGHLSNDEAFQLFVKHKPATMSHLVLSHLSKNNNCPELVNNLFKSKAGNTQIVVASRYEETSVMNIFAAPTSTIARRQIKVADNRHLQLSMF